MAAQAAPCAAEQPAQAQDDGRKTVTNAGPIVPFLEGTDVFFAVGQDTVFEADIMHHGIAFQTFSDVLDLDRQARELATRKRPSPFAFSVSGTPGVRVRMLEAVSRPVRTPSWMPRGNVQLIWVRNLAPVAAAYARAQRQELAIEAAPGNPSEVSLWEVHGIVGHHSNGQDGCFYEEQERGDDEECRFEEPIAGAPTVNTTDGSFSTNYVRIGLNYRRNRLDAESWADREWGVKGDIEYHPKSWMDSDIVETYGRTRLALVGVFASREWSWCPKRAEVSAGAQFIIGRQDDSDPVAFTIQGSCFPTLKGGWGYFIRFYSGQDYYNIRFFNDIRRLHVGFTYSQSGFFRFTKGAVGEGDGGTAVRR